MKLRLTPLNFAVAFFIVLAIITWIYKPVAVTGERYTEMSGTIALVFLLFAVMSFFLDMIFRNFFSQMKLLWMIEISFIVLTAVIYLLVR
ncbi:hypothetical protein ACFQ3S_07145 [Mucilaginibacter terrae]|uniref:hypothetical protein n=1 Tax=Mucilaginibacter terrae TaxID=1955052 RepID=UPI003624FB57